jgi:SNW domain-containing protein 1
MSTLRDVLPAPRNVSTAPSRDSAPAAPPVIVPPSTAVHAGELAPGAGVSSVVPVPSDGDFATALARSTQGGAVGRIVHADYSALVEKPRSALALARPGPDAVAETTARTRSALDPVLARKAASALPNNFRVRGQGGEGGRRAGGQVAEFVRYTPANTNSSHASGAGQRIIKMVEAQVDPMEPQRFKLKKTPANPPSPPVPVLHSPTRPLTKEEAADWVVPPSISNWKNNSGFTVALDKRLAATGRGLEDHRINDKFASMAEALYLAERRARDEVEKRAQIQRNVSLKAKEAKEKQLRDLAARAREQRAGFNARDFDTPSESEASRFDGGSVRAGPLPLRDDPPPAVHPTSPPVSRRDSVSIPTETPRRARSSRFGDMPPPPSRQPAASLPQDNDDTDDADVRRRDAIREERRKEREHEFRLRDAHGAGSGAAGTHPVLKRSKITRDRDRDISERVALGQRIAEGGASEVMYDQRLFNQGGNASRGVNAGFGADDADHLYDKPLFGGNASASAGFQYHPRRTSGDADALEDGGGGGHDTSRFKADKELGSGDPSRGNKGSGHPRTRPVEFERDIVPPPSGIAKGNSVPTAAVADDPFGLDLLMGRISAPAKPSRENRARRPDTTRDAGRGSSMVGPDSGNAKNLRRDQPSE